MSNSSSAFQQSSNQSAAQASTSSSAHPSSTKRSAPYDDDNRTSSRNSQGTSDEEEIDDALDDEDDDIAPTSTRAVGSSNMGILKSGAEGSPSHTFRSSALPDAEENEYSHNNTSPTKKRSHNRLSTTLEKLHLKHPSGQSKRDGGYSESRRDSTDHGRRSMDAGEISDAAKKGSGSGKRTPLLQKDATGDFAEFLEAEQLKAALAEEQEKEVKRELKLAKHPKRKAGSGGVGSGGGGALGGKGKVQSPAAQIKEARDREERRNKALYTPEGPTLEDRGYFPGDLRHHGHLGPHTRHHTDHQQHPHHHSPGKLSPKIQRIKPPGFCGEVSDSDESSAYTDEEEGNQTDSSTSSSSASTDILDQVVNPSMRSLKSWQSDISGGEGSLASGGANPKLAKPLLQLEELELESFLKNFGRHTREIRVPSSANFPRRRMPQWEDFKVPPGEAALAAAQGKRVTVLTHVDRGLQMMAASEGQGVPPQRPLPSVDNGGKQKGGVSLPSQVHHTAKKAEEGASSEKEEGHRRVSFAKEVGKSSTKLLPHRPSSPDMPFSGLNQRSLEMSERDAKRMEKEAEKNGGHVPSGGAGGINIHDAEREWRPSRDEHNMDEEDWELLHHADGMEIGEDEVQVPEDERVDGIAWAIAYILAMVERHAPEELDNSPDQTYRESKTRSHIERLYLIAPFWERFLYGVRRVYRWDNPSRTSSIMMIYFTLWYMDLIPTAFFCMLIFYICQFRFFPPSASYLHEQVRARMARGVDADRLAERLRRRSRLDVLEIYKRFAIAYGQEAQLACGDVADFHEKVKNLILWRNPTATWRTLTHMTITTIMVTILPSWLIWKIIFFFLGFTFFILLPLQSHYPRFRRPLSPIWWALWGAPTDAQFAIQLLRRRHLERQYAKHPPTEAELDISDEDLKTSDQAAASGVKRQPSSGSGIKNRLKHSSAAHAIAYGSMRPFTEAEGGLVDLRDTKVLNGQVTSKPRKLGSFFCQHHGVPGHLHVNTKMLYFVALHSHVNKEGKGRKTCKTVLEDVSGLVKTKSIKLFVWSSSGLQVIRKEKGSLFFSNMPHRDNAFNLLLAVGSEGE